MELSHITRRLRAAVSLFFAIAAVALCVMWGRSYVTFDRFAFTPKYDCNLLFLSYRGGFTAVQLIECEVATPFWDRGPAIEEPGFSFTHWDDPVYIGFSRIGDDDFNIMPTGLPGYHNTGLIGRSYTYSAVGLSIPYYFLSATAAIMAMASLFGLQRGIRFSLRTLLITTTLVAVALGLGVWAVG
jgi:hypothetical protein